MIELVKENTIMIKEVEKWTQIVIKDEYNLSGKSVSNFLLPILEIAKITKIVMTDVEGSFSPIAFELEKANDSSKVLEWIVSAKQFDWAFIFMFDSDLPSGSEKYSGDAIEII